MYEAYWQFDAKPFENHSDPRFYYPGESHQGALLKLRYAVEHRRGAAVLTGGAGSGKTLLLDVLERQLPESYQPIARVVFPTMPVGDLLAYLADELEPLPAASGASPQRGIDQSLRRIQASLAAREESGKHTILAIDEAHLLEDVRILESLRLLLNLEVAGRTPFTLLLVGQPGLLRTLERMPGFEERIGVKSLLRAFSPEETAAYAAFRLHAAGARRELFDSEALETLHALSHGMPRRINRLCDLALLVGFADERTSIDSAQLEAVADELVSVTAE